MGSRLGGLAFIVGVVAVIVGNILHPRTEAGALGSASVDIETKLIVSKLNVWYPSHALIAVSTPIILVGYLTLYRALRDKEERAYSLAALLSLGIGAAFATLAIVIDGFLTPIIAEKYAAAAGVEKQLAGAIFDYNFLLSLTLLGPAFLSITLGVSLVAASLAKAKLYNKWFASVGLLIGLLGVLGYLVGIFGRYWVDSLPFTPYILILNIWALVLGIFHYRGR